MLVTRLDLAFSELEAEFLLQRSKEKQAACEASLCTKVNFTKLLHLMNAKESKLEAHSLFLYRILTLPIDRLYGEINSLRMLTYVPQTNRGCCAIDSYYEFNHTKVSDFSDLLILAIAVRLPEKPELPEGADANPHLRAIELNKFHQGLNHGIQIELVDRGYRQSYNGYSCQYNPRGCRFKVK